MLTRKQQAFADYYLQSSNATDAAIKAGYSEKTAYSIGHENLKKGEIQKYIEEHTVKVQSERIADAKEVLEYLTETMRCEDETRRERTKAAELLGKRYALFIEQTEGDSAGKAPININISIEDCGDKNE